MSRKHESTSSIPTAPRYYEVVIFSSNIAGVVDPVVNALDREGCAMHRLYRDATVFRRGGHKKDLAALNRNPRKIVVVDKDAKALGGVRSSARVEKWIMQS